VHRPQNRKTLFSTIPKSLVHPLSVVKGSKFPVNGAVSMGRRSRALGFCWTPNCDENESEITRRCV
jgi:hypothetical protein